MEKNKIACSITVLVLTTSIIEVTCNCSALTDTGIRTSNPNSFTLSLECLNGTSNSLGLKFKQQENQKIANLVITDSNIPEVYREIFESNDIIDKLSLINDNITIIYSYSFGRMPNIVEIKLNHNRLKNIEPNTFTGLLKLKILHLCNNELVTLENINVPSLEELYLSSNALRTCNRDSFKGLDNLKLLNLSYNHLSSFEFINQLNSLKHLNLSHNFVVSFSENDFQNMQSLETLDLTRNFIIALHPNLFVHSHNLKQLHISQNHITEINILHTSIQYMDLSDNMLKLIFCKHLQGTVNLYDNSLSELCEFPKNVTHLNLRFNNIYELDKKDFSYLTQLITLDLSCNYIEVVDIHIFENLYNLEDLSLNVNKISILNIGTFRNLQLLKTLNISLNNIEKLDHGVFTNLNKLESLDLSENKIGNLNLNVLLPLKNLRKLYLEGNPLKVFELYELYSHLPLLGHLSISFNDVGCEELAKIIHSIDFERVFGNFELQQGLYSHTDNINGIACIPDKKHVSDFEEILDSSLNYINSIFTIFIIVTITFVILIVLICISLYQKHFKNSYVKNDEETCTIYLLEDGQD